MKMNIFCVLIAISINLSTINTASIQQIHVLFRHGDKSPTRTYPNDPHKNHKWEGGWGQLTNKGKLQMYNFGQRLRQQYKSFISNYYCPSNVSFTSSYSDRCLMSAELVGAGLFPPKDQQVWNEHLLWQPIPIHYSPRSIDNMLAMKAPCSSYDEEFRSTFKNSSKILKLNEENRNLFGYLTKHSGMNVNNIGSVESLYNVLEIEKMNNLTLPSWVNDTILNHMKYIATLNLAMYSETEFMKRMKGGVFIGHVTGLMMNHVKTPSVNMYAAHDLTIIHVMRALHLVDVIKPDLGAALFFELYSDETVKVFYANSWDDVRVEKMIENCENPCTIRQFQTALEKIIPKNWKEECIRVTNN